MRHHYLNKMSVVNRYRKLQTTAIMRCGVIIKLTTNYHIHLVTKIACIERFTDFF